MSEPLVPPEVDLRKLGGFMLDVQRLLASELVAVATPEEFRAAVLLWCRAWQQVPAASLPNDDRVLASFAMVPPGKWRKIKAGAMRGFLLCSDGRLYHKVLAEDAMRAWPKHQAFKERAKRGAEARWKDSKPSASSNAKSNASSTQQAMPADAQVSVKVSSYGANAPTERAPAPDPFSDPFRPSRMCAEAELLPAWRQWAEGEGLAEPEHHWRQFRDHYASTGEERRDWLPAWRKWAREEARRRPRDGPAPGARRDRMAAVDEVFDAIERVKS